MKKRNRAVFTLFVVLFLIGCTTNPPELSEEYKVVESYASNVLSAGNVVSSPFGTAIRLITYCEKDNATIFPSFEKEIIRLHKLFDRYNDYLDENGNKINNLKSINDSYGSGEKIYVDKDMIDLLKLSIEISELTEGYFNPMLRRIFRKFHNTKFGYNNL